MPVDVMATERDLPARCLEHLRALPFVKRATLRAQTPRGRQPSALAVYPPEKRYVLPVELRRGPLGHGAAQAVLHLAETRPGLIVFAPAVGRDLGEVFERGGVNFVDASGNCFLRLD